MSDGTAFRSSGSIASLTARVVGSIISLVSVSLSIHWHLRVHADCVGSMRCKDPGNYAVTYQIGGMMLFPGRQIHGRWTINQ